MVKIRKAAVDDVTALQSVKPTITVETIKKRLESQQKGEVEFLVLEKEGKIVSFVLLKWEGKPTHPEYPDMEDLYTKESERGRGYGAMLVKECERRAGQRSFGKIGLAVNPTLNSKAKKFYEKLAFEHDGRKSYLDGVYNGTEDWVVDLEKELN